MRVNRRTITFAGLAVVAAALCIRLGFWQLDRHAERRTANELRVERLELPPFRLDARTARASPEALALGPDGEPADSLLWRRVELVGRWDFPRELLLRNRSYQGVPGVHVVTPLLLTSDAEDPGDDLADEVAEPAPAVLVRRGWMPAPDGLQADLSAGRPERAGAAAGTERVEGILLPPEPGVDERDPPVYEIDGEEHAALVRLDPRAATDALPYPVAAFSVLATRPSVAAGGMRLVAPPEPDPGPHLMYAGQWFAFAAIALIGTFFWLRRTG